ncbi:hypothetical protein ACFPM7_08340 [Actinokineospora guangxiensis]|uniref:Uncharacterized protein n=1 Tax=Actinokineospora guangxiensis TaxID=1490288 RepID=A0ABW0EI19_9PSEU
MTAELVAGISEVFGDGNVTVTGATGPVTVHMGLGAAQAAPRYRRPLPVELVRELERVFVPGPGHGGVERALRAPGTVVVSGPPGVGRRTSALVALGNSGTPNAGFRELPDDGADSGPRFDAEAIEPGERLLLDLSADTPPLTDRIWADLASYRAAVIQNDAYLAIVLPRHVQFADIGTRVELGRPNGRQVLHRHLHALSIPEPDPTPAALARQAEHEPMRELAALALRVKRVHAAMSGAGGWPAWLAPALDAAEAHRDVVAERVGALDDGRGRALLLAAAVFDRSRPEVVALGAASLLAAVDYPEPDGHRLDRPDLGAALRPLHASIQDGQVRFDSLTYAEAVRTHFWTTFPDLRPHLRTWLDGFLRGRDAAEDRLRATRRVTRSLLATGFPADVLDLVEAWAGHPHMAEASSAALACGLEDDRHGRFFRQRVYGWAIQPALTPLLGGLLVRLCADIIAPARPQQALVRLRHLARNQHAVVADAATAALSELADRDGHFARRLLHLLHDDLTGEVRRAVNPAHFLAAADPARLTGQSRAHPRLSERHTRALVTGCWSALLDSTPATGLTDVLHRWLELGRAPLTDCLADAVRGRPVLVARLYAATRDWALSATDPDDTQRRTTTAALLRRASTEGNTP